MAKKTGNQLAARALQNVMSHATEDALSEAALISRASLFTKNEWWNASADWSLAFSRLVSSGRFTGCSDVSGVAMWRSSRTVLLPRVGMWG
jgi:hypothetical protein